MKCESGKCRNIAHRAKILPDGTRQQLCTKHYQASDDRGYVDGADTRERLALLRSRGVSWQSINEQTGLAVWWVMRHTGDVLRSTEARVFAIPLPTNIMPGGLVSAVGTTRRIQALAAIGYRLSDLNVMLGRGRNCVEQWITHDTVHSATAADVEALYARLSTTRGPSKVSCCRAAAKGWVPPAAWDDIDNPDETPTLGDERRIPFPERYQELRDCGRTNERIARDLGITTESLKRQLMRYGLYERRTA